MFKNPFKKKPKADQQLEIPQELLERWKAENARFEKLSRQVPKVQNEQPKQKRVIAPRKGPFKPADVFERDGWVCQICGKPISKKLKYPNPLSASLDMIVPPSKGGTRVWANVQASHLKCNLQKSDKLVSEFTLEGTK